MHGPLNVKYVFLRRLIRTGIGRFIRFVVDGEREVLSLEWTCDSMFEALQAIASSLGLVCFRGTCDPRPKNLQLTLKTLN